MIVQGQNEFDNPADLYDVAPARTTLAVIWEILLCEMAKMHPFTDAIRPPAQQREDERQAHLSKADD